MQFNGNRILRWTIHRNCTHFDITLSRAKLMEGYSPNLHTKITGTVNNFVRKVYKKAELEIPFG